MRWQVKQRMDFIRRTLDEKGELRRSDIMQAFSISSPQASMDIAAFNRLNTGFMVYDTSKKRYLISDSERIFGDASMQINGPLGGAVERFSNGNPSNLNFVQAVADAIAKALIEKNPGFKCVGLLDATNAAINVMDEFHEKLNLREAKP